MKYLMLINTLLTILFHNAKAQPVGKRETIQPQTIAYTYVITYYPDRKKNPLAGIGRTLMRFWIKNDKWRREEIYDNERIITIVSEGWYYFLRASEKTGTKTKVEQPTPPPTEHDPRKLLRVWLKKGAKKIGSGKVNGQECDVYYVKHPSKIGELKVKIWARKKDGLVIRIEEEGRQIIGTSEIIKVVHEFKDIKSNLSIDDFLFIVPKDYQLKEQP